MKSFITGSFAYGTPRPDSDIDVVVLMDIDEMQKLIPFASSASNGYGDTLALRFGDLNLLCEANEGKVAAWRAGTDQLMKQRPVTREAAVAHFTSLFKACGCEDHEEAPHVHTAKDIEAELVALEELLGE